MDMTGITRKAAAEILAEQFDTKVVFCLSDNGYNVPDQNQRLWRILPSDNIKAEKYNGEKVVRANYMYQVKLPSPYIEAIYPNEIYQKTNWNLKTEKGVLDVMFFLIRETPFAFQKKKVEVMEEAYAEYSFDYSCVENALDRAKDREETYGTLYPVTER